jgi:hypothetical protein
MSPKVNKPAVPREAQQRFHYSFLKILSGSDLSRRRLPYMTAVSPQTGPAVWLTACSHGEEVGGIAVVQEVFKRLRKRPLLKGSLHAFPLMNPLGFEMGTRLIAMSEEDLNRSFPGSPTGTLAERIADRIFRAITETGPSVVLDLHNDWIRSVPYTVLDPSPTGEGVALYERASVVASWTGFPIVVEQEAIRRTLSHSLMQREIAALTIELSESYVVNERIVDQGVGCVFNVLSQLDMIEPAGEPFLYPLPPEVAGRRFFYSSQPVVSTSGILRFLARPGQVVRAGQPVAKVYNAFGRLQETLTATGDALVLGLSDSSVAYPGAPVMAFGLL